MAKKKDSEEGGKSAKGKGKGGKDKAKGGKDKGGQDAVPYSSIATHPRARDFVRRAKAWTGLAGFALAALLSLQASVPLFQAGLRALVAGVAGYMLAWWFSVLIWRHLMVAEQRAAAEELKRRRAGEAEAAAKGEPQPAG